MENISCLDDVVEFILMTENFSPDDIDEALLLDNCTGQPIESTNFSNSGTAKSELNNMTKAVMESVPYADVLHNSADILSVPSFSNNYKEIEQGQQINQEPINPINLFEFSDEEFRQMINLRNVQEVVVQECPEKDIIIQSSDMNCSTNVDTILETEVECMSSTVQLPILQGEEASSSVNPYGFSRFNQKSHVINHNMLTNHTEHPFCCAICSVCYDRKSDLSKHMKIHKGPNNVSDSLQYAVPIHNRSIMHNKGSENKSDIIYQEPNTKKNNDRKKGRDKKKDLLMALKLYSKPHTCNPCGLSFTYKNALFKHANFHHRDDSVDIVSTQESNSKRYEMTILVNSKFNKVIYYACDLCKAVYNRFDFFKRHKRFHINIELGNIEGETNRCINRGLLFKSLPELELHSEQHLTVTSFPKVFKNRSSQKIYSRLHTGEQPINCKYCIKSFANCSTLKIHERTHTDKKLCASPACTKAFIQKDTSCKHIKLFHPGININSDDVKAYKCELCGVFCQSSKEFYSHLLKYSDENAAKSTVVSVETLKDQNHSKMGNQKNSYCSVLKASGQFDTEICDDEPVPTEDEPVPTEDEQYIQSIMKENDMRYNPMFVASPSESHAKTFKIVNDKLEKNEQTLSDQVSYRSKYTVLKSEHISKKQSFVLKDGECTRTCSKILYYSSRSYSTNMNSSLENQKKKL